MEDVGVVGGVVGGDGGGLGLGVVRLFVHVGGGAV